MTLLSIFRSIRFNVFLFLSIVLAAAIGTFSPSADLTHSPFFAGLLTLMAFDVVVCKLIKRPPEGETRPEIERQLFRQEVLLPLAGGLAVETAASVLRQTGYRVDRLAGEAGTLHLRARRHPLQGWGTILAHISLVVILMGALLKSVRGFELFLAVPEGQAARLAPGEGSKPGPRHFQRPLPDWTVTVDRVTVDYYKDLPAAVTFASDLRVHGAAGLLAERTLRVNQPLALEGVRFYQASWGATGSWRQATLRAGERTFTVAPGEAFPIPGQPWTGRIERYWPDFVVHSGGQPGTASPEWRNPALTVGIYNRAGSRTGTLVLPAASPATGPQRDSPALMMIGGQSFQMKSPFEVLAVDPILFAGIDVAYDPGFPVVVAGVITLLAGLGILLFLHQRRLEIRLRPEANGTRLEIAGWSSRGAEFREEFQRLMQRLQAKPGA